MLEICGGMVPLAPSGYAYGCKKRMKKKGQYLLYLMFNLPLTKRSQQRNTTSHCRTPIQSNIVVVEKNVGKSLISVEDLRQW